MRYSYVPESDAAHEARMRPWLTSEREIVPPPLVPARPPLGPHEFADKRQAGTLGRTAMDRGWQVRPLYYRAHDGAEYCALRMMAGPLRAVATWVRPVGAGSWASDVAYAWDSDQRMIPRKINITELTSMIKQVGEVKSR
jgi:hypothetical protein